MKAPVLQDDALLAVALGADAVGFVFASSPRQVAAQRVYDITRRLPPEILTVGVFRDEHPSRVIDTVNRAGLKAAQLHGHETPQMVAEVASQIRWVIKAVTSEESMPPLKYEPIGRSETSRSRTASLNFS